MEQRLGVWVNSRYQVSIFPEETADHLPMIHLSIKCRQLGARHDWRDFQRIKNELVGPECEAVEVYPAEERLVDSADQFHLWVFPPQFRLPFGFNERLVSDAPPSGGSQRPFEPGARPLDALNAEQLAEYIQRVSSDQ